MFVFTGQQNIDGVKGVHWGKVHGKDGIRELEELIKISTAVVNQF